jgi:hypothetical protein
VFELAVACELVHLGTDEPLVGGSSWGSGSEPPQQAEPIATVGLGYRGDLREVADDGSDGATRWYMAANQHNEECINRIHQPRRNRI